MSSLFCGGVSISQYYFVIFDILDLVLIFLLIFLVRVHIQNKYLGDMLKIHLNRLNFDMIYLSIFSIPYENTKGKEGVVMVLYFEFL